MPQISSANLPAVAEAILGSSGSAAVPVFSFRKATPVVPMEADGSVSMAESSTANPAVPLLLGSPKVSCVIGVASPSACPAEAPQTVSRTEPSVPPVDSTDGDKATTKMESTVPGPTPQTLTAVRNQTFTHLENPPKKSCMGTSHSESSLFPRFRVRNAKESARSKRKSKYVQTQPLYQEYWSKFTGVDPSPGSPGFHLDRSRSVSMAAMMTAGLLSPPLMSPRDSTFSSWQEIPQVKKSGLLKHITPQERRLQETVFEVVTSEASYLRSLSLAVNHFQRSQKLTQCLCVTEVHTLFSNLQQVKDVSESFLMDLEEQLEVDVFLSGIGELFLKHCPSFHKVYVPYVTNQMYQEQLAQRLMQENLKFLQVLQKLEQQPVCQRQTLKSFLVLPFQRITRLKILLETILKRSKVGSVMAVSVGRALKAVSQIVSECNEGVGRMKQTEALVRLVKQVQFLKTRSIPLISRGRWLLREGMLSEILLLESSPGQRPRICTRPLYLHLFCDLLLISRLENDLFLVEDYACSSNVKAENFKAKALGLPSTAFLMCLRQNHNGSSCSFILEAASEDEKKEWVSLLSSQGMFQDPSSAKTCGATTGDD
ncbi:rho guanine nucleotide exchange factor 19-like [Lissotriton helveticus]